MSDFDDSSDDYPMVDRPNSRMPSPVAPEDGASDEFTAPGRDDDTSARRGSNQSEEEEEEEEEDTVHSLSVSEFVSYAKQLLQSGDMASFARFVLNGLHEGFQYQVDPIKNALKNSDRIQALRDYDSILGIHRDICVTSELTVYPVSKFEDTLSRNIHIKTSFNNRFVRP